MVRSFLGSLLALAGAAVAVWSPFLRWYGRRRGADIRVNDLFTGVGVTPRDAAVLGSLFLPMAFAALLALLGVLMRSRMIPALAGALVLGVTVLWMVRQAQFSGSLTAGGDGLDTGVASAVAGGLLLFAAAYLTPGQRAARPAGPYPDQAPAGGGPPYGDGTPYGVEAPYTQEAAYADGAPYEGRTPSPDQAPYAEEPFDGPPTLIGEPPGLADPTLRGDAVPPLPPYLPDPPLPPMPPPETRESYEKS
ncbi:hypothetical protein OG552_14355 [Streptomyces sp. NBC_01476]|uniref:hypothetical protein n=1 Tax=Streptomyces sp. NBC_01476 TaxID=2903881 RepID=UPI002E306864|nr:hypothetical protein [Streptomyces sp. NBC_01476]